jgi:hypothetical protein
VTGDGTEYMKSIRVGTGLEGNGEDVLGCREGIIVGDQRRVSGFMKRGSRGTRV